MKSRKVTEYSWNSGGKREKCAEWLSLKAFMKPNGANGKNGVTQRKAEY
jgi:hypothetical protein